MSYQSISDVWHRRLQGRYFSNRCNNGDCDALGSYNLDVAEYARKSKRKMRDHCARLMEVLSNPVILHAAAERMGWRKWIKADAPADFVCDDIVMWEWLRGLGEIINEGLFDPGKYKRVSIPKIGKTGSRWIEVPPFETRVVARAALKLLNPILDPNFHPLSIGFRPRRGIQHGLAAASQLYTRGNGHLVCVDIRDAFGTVPLDRCLQVLRSRLFNSPIVDFVETLNGKKRSHGLVQGVPTSPLLLNVYLDHFLDSWWKKTQGDGQNFVRYADDIAIFCKSHDEAIHAYRMLAKRLTVIGLSVKEPEDQAIKSLDKGEQAGWLGFRVQSDSSGLQFRLGESSWEKLEMRFAELKNKSKLGLEFDVSQRATMSGTSWLEQKAPGISKSKIGSVFNRLQQTAAKYGFTLGGMSINDAESAWEKGIKRYTLVHNQLQEWFCLGVLTEDICNELELD